MLPIAYLYVYKYRCFFGPIIAGLISDKWFAKVAADGEIAAYGYKYIFLMCTLIMIFIGIFIWIVCPKWLGEIGKYPVSKDKKLPQNP